MLAISALSVVLFQAKLHYPPAHKSTTVYDYAGTKVADPYSWLEDLDSAQTRSWVAAERKLTSSYLSNLPERAQIAKKEHALISYERYAMQEKQAGRYFFTKQLPSQNQPVTYVSDSLKSPGKALLDPNKLSSDGTVALSGSNASPNGKWLAYSLSSSGSDWQEWKVRNVDTGKDTKDDIKWSKFSNASWTKDALGFFYVRFDKPAGDIMKAANYNQKLYYHRRGASQSDDLLVYQRSDQPEWGFEPQVTEDGKMLVILAWNGTQHENRIYVRRMWPVGITPKPANHRLDPIDVTPVFDKGDAAYTFLGNLGKHYYFQSDKDSPLGKVIEVDISPTGEVLGEPKVVVPEAKEALSSASIVGGRIFASYLKDAHSVVRIFDLQGHELPSVKLPGIGSAAGFGGKMADTETFYTYQSYTSPSTIYHYDVRTGQSTVFKKPKVPFDGSKFTTEQVFFASKDGTRIPMFLSYRKGLKRNGLNPTLIYGYGGFNINELPAYSSSVALWMEMGGVYADVVLRGGSEYGEAWHKAGMLHNKQNVFDDFISGAEWLIAKKYTSTPKLACEGGSNGGLLIGAVETQRPDLWGATIPEVGVMDMLRFNKFTIGHAWMTEYGNPDSAEDFPYIYKYSPLHNIKPGTHYPPTLIETADHDDRVFPAHSFKFAATMQADQAGSAPILIRIESKAGHGAGMPISKIIEELADGYAFLLHNLHMKLPAGFGK